MELSPAEQLAHSTVRIECDMPDGRVGTGTGFFYSLNREGNQHVPVIITNKHVVKDALRGRFFLTLQGDSGGPRIGHSEAFELTNFESCWKPHPNEAIDLCAMPLAPLLRQAEERGSKFFFIPFDKTLIPTKDEVADMIGLENITMVGYPDGIWDKPNNLPVFRRGVLASDYKYDWNGKAEFLIDAACFPGSSGSPVMLFDVGGYQTRKTMIMGSSRVKLLGILYAGPQHTIEGDVRVVMVPTQHKAVSIAGIPNNLGIIIKSDMLLAFEGIFQ